VINSNEILPGVMFHSYVSEVRKEKVCFLGNNTLVLQVAGQLTFESAVQKISMKKGEMLLIGKNQLGQLTKNPVPDEGRYETIVITLQEEMLRKIALEEQIKVSEKYIGLPNVLVPSNPFLKGYFQSIIPYVQNPEEKIATDMGVLKIKELVKLLLRTDPDFSKILFDFSEAHKIDLEKFMISNYHFNVSIEKFAELTGRSLAGFKRDFQRIFNMSPRVWLQEKRLIEAQYLIAKKNMKPSAIYLDLGFETLSHFSHSFKKRFGMAPSEVY
jgi:AraC-like DNA-binding protein